MRKTPSKDVSVQNGHQRTTTAQTDEQKAFEMEVQELIRQAKQQLKATSPFREEENAQSLEAESAPHTETPAVSESPAPVIPTPVQATETPIVSENPAPVIPQPIQAEVVGDNGPDPAILEALRTDLQQARDTITELQARLIRQEEEAQQKSQERQPIYGHAAAQPATENMTRDDLKLEFLNFTSAHIDQFNTRIKKTEDLVAAIAQSQPRVTTAQPAKPGWMQWVNTFLLSICTLLLLGLFFSRPQDVPGEEKTVTAPSEKTAEPETAGVTPPASGSAAPAEDKAVTASNKPLEQAAPSTTTATMPPATTTAAAPAQANKPQQPPQAVKSPVTASTPAQPKPAVAAQPRTINSAPVPQAKTPTAPPAPQPKPLAAKPDPQPKASPAVVSAKPPVKAVPTAKAAPATTTAKAQPAAKSNTNAARNLSLQEALRPVTDEELSRERNARRAVNEPKPVVRKTAKPAEPVSFGDD